MEKLTIKEQVEIINEVLSDPKFMDDDQLIEAGIKPIPKLKKGFEFD